MQKHISVEGDRVAGVSLHSIECPPCSLYSFNNFHKMWLLVSRSSNYTSQHLNSSRLAARAGSIYLYSHDVGRVQVSTVDHVVLHPSFSAGASSVAGDIALVMLANPLNVTDSVRPVCLHSDSAVDAQPGSSRYGVCVVAGWAPSRATSSCKSLFCSLIVITVISASFYHCLPSTTCRICIRLVS